MRHGPQPLRHPGRICVIGSRRTCTALHQSPTVGNRGRARRPRREGFAGVHRGSRRRIPNEVADLIFCEAGRTPHGNMRKTHAGSGAAGPLPAALDGTSLLRRRIGWVDGTSLCPSCLTWHWTVALRLQRIRFTAHMRCSRRLQAISKPSNAPNFVDLTTASSVGLARMVFWQRTGHPLAIGLWMYGRMKDTRCPIRGIGATAL